jgi:hypothetical protein
MNRALPACLAAVVLVTACGGGDDDSEPASPEVTTADGLQATTAAATTTAAASTTSVAATTTTEPASELAEEFGLPTIAIMSTPVGGGERPDLAWQPVDGAADYQVTVLDPDGGFYWGWRGATSEVPFGGRPRLLPGAAGPRVVTGMTWTVVALDANGRPLAAGGPAPLLS